MTEEIWSVLGHEGTVSYEAWPTYDESKLVSDTITIIAQVNGKLRARIDVPANISKDDMLEVAMAHENVQTSLQKRNCKNNCRSRKISKYRC